MVSPQNLRISVVLFTLTFSCHARAHSTADVDVASADPCFDSDDHASCAVVLLQRRAALLTKVPEISHNSSIDDDYDVSGDSSSNRDELERLQREHKLVEVIVESLTDEEKKGLPNATVDKNHGIDEGTGEKRSKIGNRSRKHGHSHNSSRMHASTKRGLQDIAIGVISGRPEYWGAVHWSMLAYVPKGMILEAPGKCNCNFRAGFKRLIHDRPNASWYYVGDEDAFIYLERLQTIVDRYDPSVPTLLASPGSSGTFAEYCGDTQPIKREDGTVLAETFYGGTGFIVSRALAKHVDFGAECSNTLADTGNEQLSITADHDLSCLIAESWKHSFKFIELPAVHGNACEMNGDCENRDNLDAKFKFAQELNWPAPIAVVHHLSPNKIEAMAKYNENVSAGQYWKRTAKLWDNTGHCKVNPNNGK